MHYIAKIFIVISALFHLYVLRLEMFARTTRGKKVFSNFPKDLFEKTKTLAANQGLYNGFLAAGLIWSLCISDPIRGRYVAIFFLSCVIIAGVYGGITADKKIFFTQAVPALLAWFLLLVQ